MKQRDSVGIAQTRNHIYLPLNLAQVTSLNEILNSKLQNDIVNDFNHANIHTYIGDKFMEKTLEYFKGIENID